MRHRKPCQRRQPRSKRSIRQRIESLQRSLRLVLCKSGRVLESTCGLNSSNDRFQLSESAVLDGQPNGGLL